MDGCIKKDSLHPPLPLFCLLLLNHFDIYCHLLSRTAECRLIINTSTCKQETCSTLEVSVTDKLSLEPGNVVVV